MKKRLVGALSILLAAGLALSGCGTDTTGTDAGNAEGEQITVTVGAWPKENNEHELKIYEQWKADFEADHPNVTIVPEPYSYDARTFVAKAASGQMPNYFSVPYTEPAKIVQAGYAADITEQVKKFGYDQELMENALDICTVDGGIYGLPRTMYVLGLWCNVNLFTQAGLVDENGVPQFPKTWEEVREKAAIIKQQTGKDGFLLPAKDNTAGWHFTNIAWNYGVEFETEVDGKWQASFNTPECIEALQLIKDMKHVDDSLPDNALLGYADILKNFALDQVGMVIGAAEAPMANMMINQYQMEKDNISICSIPEGPKDKVGLMGGDVIMFSPQSSPAQVEAGIEFLKACGYSPVLDEVAAKGMEDQFQADIANNNIVLPEPMSVWKNEERNQKEKEIRAKYANVKPELYQDYYDNATKKIKPEPTYNSQDLYKEFSSLIQSILTDPNADIPALVETAQNTFQTNYLDKIE